MNVETPMCVLTKLMVLLLLFFYYSVLNISLMTDVFSMGSLNVNGAREAKKGHSFTRLLKQNNWMSFFYKRPIVVVRTRECGEGNGKER